MFFGSFSYTGNLPGSKSGVEIDPGNTIGLSLGSILAAGPGTSLPSSLDLSFSRQTEVDTAPFLAPTASAPCLSSAPLRLCRSASLKSDLRVRLHYIPVLAGAVRCAHPADSRGGRWLLPVTFLQSPAALW